MTAFGRRRPGTVEGEHRYEFARRYDAQTWYNELSRRDEKRYRVCTIAPRVLGHLDGIDPCAFRNEHQP